MPNCYSCQKDNSAALILILFSPIFQPLVDYRSHAITNCLQKISILFVTKKNNLKDMLHKWSVAGDIYLLTD